MKSTNLQFLYFSFLSCLNLLASCGDEKIATQPNPTPNPNSFTLNVELTGLEENYTRAILDTGNDRWSITGFSDNGDLEPDKIGFYSLYGNKATPDGNGSFINEPMEYRGSVSSSGNGMSSFISGNMDSDINAIVYNKTAAYYPYCESMEEEGLELRRKVEVDGIEQYRCEDFLFMSNLNESGSQVVAGLSARFNHAFTSVVFLRGEGFDQPDNPEIIVVLDRPITHARLVDNKHPETQGQTNAWKMVELDYVENNSLGLSSEDARKWCTWQGENYENREAWYTILPTMAANQERASVAYIIIEDNYGQTHHISNVPLYNGNNLFNGRRFYVEIEMEELGPTIRPFKIEDWDEDIDVTETHAPGISSATDLFNWVRDYNLYLQDDNESNTETMRQYGDLTISGNSKQFHFYITDDFDCQGVDGISTLQVTELKDILDGSHNTISNLSLENSGLFAKISEGGKIINLRFDAMTVNNSSNTATGTLAEEIEGGSIENCKIDATVVSNGPAGILAGKIKGGTISDNTFTGLVIGSQTSENPKGLAGDISSAPEFNDNNMSGVLFMTKSN